MNNFIHELLVINLCNICLVSVRHMQTMWKLLKPLGCSSYMNTSSCFITKMFVKLNHFSLKNAIFFTKHHCQIHEFYLVISSPEYTCRQISTCYAVWLVWTKLFEKCLWKSSFHLWQEKNFFTPKWWNGEYFYMSLNQNITMNDLTCKM